MTIANHQQADVCVIGAGIFGLSVAWAARARGMSVRVVDAAGVGAGASGGIVGALSPHVPEQWNGKKQFQLDALLTAEAHWRRIDRISGGDSGYGRHGRLMPLPSADTRARAEARAVSAAELWGPAARWQVLDTVPGLLSPEMAPFGAVMETLSGRLFPRKACASLAGALAARGVKIEHPVHVTDVRSGRIETIDGAIHAAYIVVAAGVPGFDLLEPHIGPGTGTGVKGQAALLRAVLPPNSPTLFDDGLYVVPHRDGTVAVGSTSENSFADEKKTDHLLEDVLRRARRLCPALGEAQVVERWAAARPKARRRDPMLGPVPSLSGVFAVTGAFKIGFGLAHRIGEAAADMLEGKDPGLPASFTLAHHLTDGSGQYETRKGHRDKGPDARSAQR